MPLASLVFGDTAGVVVQQVGQDVQQAIGQWEPTVNLINVNLDVSDTPEGLAGVTVEYSPGQEVTSTATISTATVLVGGTVVGNS